MNKLLLPYQKNGFTLRNRMVMAPMTRSRAIDNIPNDLMAEYYGQRNGAGLIITEGTAPLAAGLGYPRIPGIFTTEQINGWKKVTRAVHKADSRIFLQLMHTGRIGHIDNLPNGARLVGPSAIKASGQIATDTKGMQDHSEPVALTTEEIRKLIDGYVTAANNAIAAGFDGVEIHAANGYLPEQFLNPNVNDREDEYGGNIVNRSRFVVTIAEKIAAAIGKEKTGIRISPFSTLGDLQPYAEEEVRATYGYLAAEMNRIGVTYIHISTNANSLEKGLLAVVRSGFSGTFIYCNGLTPAAAGDVLESGTADLVAFGRSFLANPDFVTRVATDAPLNQPDFQTLYTSGEKGYTDYPVL
ncbi:MAG TPA: alkene reductase [Puia sp.]|nr:alkene reductase [Puia sp.]